MYTQPANQDLVRDLRLRDPDVIDRLIEKFGKRLYRYLLALTGNRTTAEDVFQETWVRVLERGYQYNGTCGFQTWLFRIARNLVIDNIRHKSPASLDAITWNGEQADWPDRAFISPLDRLCSKETEIRLRTQIHRLPISQQEVLLLRVDEELTLAEIAETTRVPLSTVKRRFYSGVSALQLRLRQKHRTFAVDRRPDSRFLRHAVNSPDNIVLAGCGTY